jgi:ABC-2 type transport system permease protein
MNTPSNAVPLSPLDSQAIAPAALSARRPFYWSVRRELWENRSIYLAPLAVAAVTLLGSLISLIYLPRSVREVEAMDPAHQPAMLAHPSAHIAMLLLVTSIIVAIFYSLDALHSERRDRSILFWKSLPISDRTTVLSKACIPLVALPLISFVIIVTLQWILFWLSMLVLLATGAGAATLWKQLPLFQMQLVLLYGLIAIALWHAPIYAWLLLVSGWARRATFLWAVLPLVAVGVFEKIAFRTSYFGSLIKDRLFGFAWRAFAIAVPGAGMPDPRVAPAVDPHFIPLTLLTPGKFLSTPGLWVGLIVAAAFLAAAVRLRHYREPI